jgi:hypothetical protein
MWQPPQERRSSRCSAQKEFSRLVGLLPVEVQMPVQVCVDCSVYEALFRLCHPPCKTHCCSQHHTDSIELVEVQMPVQVRRAEGCFVLLFVLLYQASKG